MPDRASPSQALYLGLISGTSTDAIDAVAARFEPAIRIEASLSHRWPQPLRQRIVALARSRAQVSLDELGSLDAAIGEAFAGAANRLLDQAGIERARVRAIGSHGQTVCHRPDGKAPFSMQLGDPARIAEGTGIDVVADFRRADIAAGGQGAPLLPVLHQSLLADATETRVVLNLGGIANITVLAPGKAVIGFDTGPANCLMDAWASRQLGQAFDRDGAWAAHGRVDQGLLAGLLADPYFQRPPPKSSGREHFNLDWLQARLDRATPAVDVQATLEALSVASMARAIDSQANDAARVIVCGGGVHNAGLMAALAKALAPRAVDSSAAHGIDPDFLEATAFAWLARQRLLGLPGNLPSVTGARGPRLLGVMAAAPQRSG